MVHVDVKLSERDSHDTHIKSLIRVSDCDLLIIVILILILQPSDSHMDLNIGTAFWFASRGVGYLQPHSLSEREASFAVRSENKHLLRLGGQQQPVKVNISATETEGDAAAAAVKVPCGRVGCKRIKKVGCSQDFCKDCCIKTELCAECSVHRKYLKKGKQQAAASSGDEIGVGESFLCLLLEINCCFRCHF